jgi:hypothetical protein
MKKLLLPLLAALLLPAAFPAQAAQFTDEQFCKESKSASETINAQGPQWIDEVTRQDSFDVSCIQKSLEYTKFVNVNSSDMPAGWEKQMQAASSQYYCQSPELRLAMQHEWTVTVNITLADGAAIAVPVVCGK